MQKNHIALALLLGGSSLAGCATPFSQDVRMDWSEANLDGTITVSGPKMYRREMLIDERRKEIGWLDDQIEKSKTIEFKPELARELEQISAFAGALGLNFDPASGLDYRRSKETGDLQQQIDVMKLELQLDQLRRDAELVRAGFAAQADPVNADLGKLGNGSVGSAAGGTAGAADQLAAAIEALMTSIRSRIDADGKQAALAANVSMNPADQFRDRVAYRNLLKSARNAASLDDLHDSEGGALIRLNFQTTILPDPRHARVPGVIQMKIRPPALDDEAVEQIYMAWLDHLNESLNLYEASGWRSDWRLLNSPAADNFDVLAYRVPKKGAAAGNCSGLDLDSGEDDPEGCDTLRLAVPRFAGTTIGEGAYSTLAKYLAFDPPDPDATRNSMVTGQAHGLIAEHAQLLRQNCGLPARGSGQENARLSQLRDRILQAHIRATGGEALDRAIRAAERALLRRKITVPSNGQLSIIRSRMRDAQFILATFENAAFADARCATARGAFRRDRPRPVIPDRFARVVRETGDRVSVYEVGPREQVQQISTVARSANGLSLAVSLAASKPGSGAAANAAAGYSRQAMGRAQAIERVPAVVGFANNTADSFGWVLGPQAYLNPKGGVTLRHAEKSYDLSVDLSVPGWWPHFMIDTVTRWSPGRGELLRGQLQGAPRQTRVPMRPNSGDFAGISTLLANREIREVGLDDLNGLAVRACRSTTLLLSGANIWRATTVLIGGKKLDEKAIGIAPDMSGILIEVPELDEAIGAVSGSQVPIVVLTPYGDARGMIDYEPKPAAGCKPESVGARAAADKPSIADLTPNQFVVPADLSFDVRGAKLDQVDGASLGGQPGTIKSRSKDGKRIVVTFAAAQTGNLAVSRTVRFTLLKGDEPVAEKLVEVTANNGGN